VSGKIDAMHTKADDPAGGGVTSDTPAPQPGTGDRALLPEKGPGKKGEPAPREIGGRDGPDPTRYGDWEKNGRCIDF